MAGTRMCKGKYPVSGKPGCFEEFKIGQFHQWGSNYEEFENGAGNYSVAIVELPDGKVVMPMANDIQFIGIAEEQVATPDIAVKVSSVVQNSPDGAEPNEDTSEVQKLISALSEGKCKGIKGATIYKIAQFAAEMGLM